MHLKELERLKAVARFLTFESGKLQELNEIVKLAADICGKPAAMITLLDKDSQHIKYSFGTDIKETPRDYAFCNHIIHQDDVVVIRDTAEDIRFADNPLCDEFSIRFYAGSPLKTTDGYTLGGLCVIDQVPGELSGMQEQMLGVLSRQVIHTLESEYHMHMLKEQYLEAKNAEIKLRSFFESSPSCHMLIDKDLKIIVFNKALAEFMLNNHQMVMKVGENVMQYVGEEFTADFLQHYHTALKGEAVKTERSLVHAGREIWWQFDYNPAFDPNDEIIGVSYNAIDISELKKAQQDTLDRDQSLKAIAYIQAHEVRRPVSSILGLMNLFKFDGYQASADDLMMMERAVIELDEKIQHMVKHTSKT